MRCRARCGRSYVLPAFARAKARYPGAPAATVMNVLTPAPIAWSRGDTLLWGSVCVDGIVVAVSGMQPWYDEGIGRDGGVRLARDRQGTARHRCARPVCSFWADAMPEPDAPDDLQRCRRCTLWARRYAGVAGRATSGALGPRG